MSYFFFFYQSPSSSLCTYFDAVSFNTVEILSINPYANIFVFGEFHFHHKDWLTCSGGTNIPGKLCQTTISQTPAQLSDCNSHSPGYISSDPSFCSAMAFLPLENSDLVVSVSIDFPLNSKVDVPFHCTAFDYSLADWASLWDHLGAVLLEDIFKCSACAAFADFLGVIPGGN